MSLEIKGVNKRFGGLQALDDVNLNVEEGTIHAIIGLTAPVSRSLNCFIGKLMPDPGTVTFDGRPAGIEAMADQSGRRVTRLPDT